jgi:cytosine/adenosine deaminase-related metal-dependent hydrolase
VEWEGNDVWFAHCCMLDDAECKQFADQGIGIAHCPSSNLRLASGASDYADICLHAVA